jgi:tetratricopeptide (TPR) repeat protein
LRAAIASSYELLENQAQALFRWLGLFVGGWTLEALDAVYAGSATWQQERNAPPPSSDTRSLAAILSALVEHSLIVQGPPSGAAPRFTMLETIREYALELLTEGGEATTVQRAHAAYFLNLAERAERELHGPEQVAWLDQLEAEHPNLRAALEWALQAGDSAQALRFGGALWWFWYVRGYISEGRRWLDRVLDAASPRPNKETPAAAHELERTAQFATALFAAGYLALFQGDFVAARARLGTSLELWRELAALHPTEPRVRHGRFSALTFLMLSVHFEGDNAALASLSAEYLALQDTLDDPRDQALMLFNLGRGALLQQGDYLAARTQLEQSLELLRALGDVWTIAQVVIDLGLVALYQEDYGPAQAWYEEGLNLARALKDRALIASALNNLGEVARCQDDDERACRLYAESLQLHQELGNKPETPRLLHNLGYLALHRGDCAQAAAYFRESLESFERLGMTRGVAENLAGFAAVAASCGRAAEAARLWGTAEALHETVGTPVWPSDRREQLRYQAIARAQLDTTSWEAAWQQGRANPLAQPTDFTSRIMS